MSELVRSKYGNILFVFCGGGCRAIMQAVAAAELVRAGFTPTHIVSSSAGTCNALGFVENPGIVGAEKTLRIWEEYITSPEAIYEIHPFLREKVGRLLGIVPQVTRDDGSSGSVFYEARRTMKFASMIISLAFRVPLRLVAPTVDLALRLIDALKSPQKSLRRFVLEPEFQQAVDQVHKYLELDRMRAFLDPFPLLARLAEQIDLQKVLASPIVWNILAERYEDGATVVFSNRDPDLAMDGSEDPRSLKAKHDRFFKEVRASMALYPLFEMVEIDGYRYLDADLANPLPIEVAFRSGCETVFIFLTVPKETVRIQPYPLRDLFELNGLMRVSQRYIHQRIREAQVKAKELGVNLFVIRPDDIPPGLGLLEIDNKVIDLVKNREQRYMREYLANLDAHNLRFAQLIP
ncbi:MAG: patatin-like phospholipase family protein, partial [Nitrospiraceae bacterium]